MRLAVAAAVPKDPVGNVRLILSDLLSEQRLGGMSKRAPSSPRSLLRMQVSMLTTKGCADRRSRSRDPDRKRTSLSARQKMATKDAVDTAHQKESCSGMEDRGAIERGIGRGREREREREMGWVMQRARDRERDRERAQ